MHATTEAVVVHQECSQLGCLVWQVQLAKELIIECSDRSKFGQVGERRQGASEPTIWPYGC